LILINHEITYDTGMLGHLCPVDPPFKGQGESAPVMHTRSGVPDCTEVTFYNISTLFNRNKN